MVTLIVTTRIRNFGKLYFYVSNWKGTLFGKDDYGGEILCKDINTGERFKFELEFELYNSSEVPKNLRNAHIEFVVKNKSKKFFFRNNVSIKDIVARLDEPYTIKVINIPPKHMINLNIYRYINKDDLPFILNVEKIYFVAQKANNRVYRKIITKINTYNSIINNKYDEEKQIK